METVTDFLFLAPKSLQMVNAACNERILVPWKKSNDQPRQHTEGFPDSSVGKEST